MGSVLPLPVDGQQLLAALYGALEPPSGHALRQAEHFLLLFLVFWASSAVVRCSLTSATRLSVLPE